MDRSSTGTMTDMYAYPEQGWSMLDLSGYQVEATDGEIGSVDETTNEVGSGSLIVDTGPWIFGRKVMLPAGVISRIDEGDQRIWVNLTKDQIKNSPEFDETAYTDQAYRDEVGTYYGSNRPAGPDFGRDDRI